MVGRESGASRNSEEDVVEVVGGGGSVGRGEDGGGGGEGGVFGSVGGIVDTEGLIGRVKAVREIATGEDSALELAARDGKAPCTTTGLGSKDGRASESADCRSDVGCVVAIAEVAGGGALDSEGVAEGAVSTDGVGDAVGDKAEVAALEGEGGGGGIVVLAGGVGEGGDGE
ncbi:hypothetical protein FWG86_00810 [Candidatus Saccharibacteria bacterium]|nr:hypothetical protein [Candidatus Saccharibacteria bacterium]